mgnify:CR=1 FL=1
MKIIGIVNDLFIKAKIRTVLNHTNYKIIFVSSLNELETEIKDCDTDSCKIIVDLNFNKFDIFSKLGKINPKINVISFFSHVDLDLKNKAKSFSSVIYPRSIFFEKLLELLES